MDELVELVVEKTGFPEDKARLAVETVVNFIKEKLPDPLADQIDLLLKGEFPTDLSFLGDLGSLFGKK